MHLGFVAQLGIEHYSKTSIGDNAEIGIKNKTGNRKRPGTSRTLLVAAAMLVVTVCLYSQTERSGGEQTPRTWGTFQKMEPAVATFGTGAVPNDEPIRVLIQFVEEQTGSGPSVGPGLAEERPDQEARASQRAQNVRDAGGIPDMAFTNIPVVSAWASRSALQYLASDPRVTRISRDHKVQGSLNTTARAIGADLAWAGSIGQPAVTGNGVRVAVLDSGMADEGDVHDAVIKSVRFVEGDTKDQYGHGTHVAGIIAGNGSHSKDYAEVYKGIAPSAKIINLKVLDETGAGLTSDVLAGLSWCLTNRVRYNIRVINLSLGHPVYESYKTDPLCQMVEKCVRSGMVVVVAAGNSGKASDGSPIYGGITSPANDPAVITVGAVDTHGTAFRSDDTVASYSSRGPTPIDGVIKPDLVAPGNRLIAKAEDHSALFKNYPGNRVVKRDNKPGIDYFVLSGTSMAAPVVSGTVALMLEANPSLTPNGVKAILAYTAERMATPHILAQGNGYLNAEGAVRLAFAISQTSNLIAAGSRWISNSESLQPWSMIQGDAVLWGDTVLWGDGVVWGDALRKAVLWGETLMVMKQNAYGSEVLWGQGTFGSSLSITGASSCWEPSVQIGHRSILQATASRWYPLFVDPTSLSVSEDILARGEFGVSSQAVLGPPGAWFYPSW